MLAVWLAFGIIAGDPAQTAAVPAQQPVFTATADYVTFPLRVLNKRDKTPRLGLTADNFIVKVDGKTRTLARVEVLNAGTPAHAYLLAFEPTPAERDGKSHKMAARNLGACEPLFRPLTHSGEGS